MCRHDVTHNIGSRLHSISQRHQRMTEPRPWLKYAQKIGHLVREMLANRQTDRQTRISTGCGVITAHKLRYTTKFWRLAGRTGFVGRHKARDDSSEKCHKTIIDCIARQLLLVRFCYCAAVTLFPSVCHETQTAE